MVAFGTRHGDDTASVTREKPTILFARLRKLRELEKKHLPFVRSLAEFDLLIEIGYHEERGMPLTYKHILTLGFCGRSTLNRRINSLIEQGIIVRARNEHDGRSSVLGVSRFAVQRLHRYHGGMVALLADA